MLHGVRVNKPGLMAVPLLAAGLLIASPRLGIAEESGDLDAGRQLAEKWCSNCHVVGPTQQRGVSTGAPTFASIAEMKTTTEMGLHAFLQTPHQRMPDLHLSREEIDDVAAYILSLRRSPAH
jgi:mono/diheme cytochrome c family protein